VSIGTLASVFPAALGSGDRGSRSPMPRRLSPGSLLGVALTDSRRLGLVIIGSGKPGERGRRCRCRGLTALAGYPCGQAENDAPQRTKRTLTDQTSLPI
jgi:hypothetical protein